jgi:transketolase
MGAAEMTLLLWSNFLRFNPKETQWKDRDRFVLSAGHASMLLYSLLHLFGYDCSLEDIKQFRQMGSRTAGHPEYGHLPGIETTTGPLGQGIANAVGLALGQALAAGKFNDAQGKPFHGRTWCLAGDGCMMEGVSNEAASLAGHLGLNNLTLIYDQNHITIDGSTNITFTEDVGKRYEAYGWNVLHVDAYDQAALADVFAASMAETAKPSLIIAKSIIGHGAATLEGKAATHGQALGVAELEATKKKLNWPLEPFFVPEEARAWCAKMVEKKLAGYQGWLGEFEAWKKFNAALATELEAQYAQVPPAGFENALSAGMAAEKAATRKHSGKVIQGLAKALPWFIGGSADLAESNSSHIKDGGVVGRGADGRFSGRNINFGVREHAMAAICNGLVLHGAWRPFNATFMQFADYMRPSIRLAALMKLKNVFMFTHDSIFLGEDGPTHQPIEHLSALRLIPGLTLWRPADGLETAMAWAWTEAKAAGPVVLSLSRQNVPVLDFPQGFDAHEIWKGAYVLQEEAAADLTFIATGAEVGTAVDAAKELAKSGLKARIVSMPSVCVFQKQDQTYRESVLGKAPRVVVEAGSTGLWASYVGSEALVIGVDSFGASAPAEALAKHFGLTAPQIAERVRAWLDSKVKMAGR